MASTTAGAFSEFADIIKLTEDQKRQVEVKRRATKDYLLEGFDSSSDMPLLETTLIGSVARNTIIRPLDDVDIMAVFSDENDVYENSYSSDSQAFLQRIRKVLGEEFTVTAGARGQVVRLYYKTGPDVDIAPVFRSGSGGYLLPSGDGSWITTDPGKQKEWFSQENERLSWRLSPLVRILKRWNNEHSKHFRSYHLEVVAAAVFSSIGPKYREALARFFEWASNHVNVDDPAGHSGDLSDYLTTQDRSALLLRLSHAAERANKALKAEDDGNHEEAIRLWRIELGNEFPSYG